MSERTVCSPKKPTIPYNDPSLAHQHIPGYPNITFDYLLGKLSTGSEFFKKQLYGGGRVQKIEIHSIGGNNGFVSNIFRFIVELVFAKDDSTEAGIPFKFSAFLKVFSLDRLIPMLDLMTGENEEKNGKKKDEEEILDSDKLAELAIDFDVKDGKVRDGKRNLESKGEKKIEEFSKLHQTECAFYEFIEQTGEEPPLPIPRVYFFKGLNKNANSSIEKLNDEREENEIEVVTEGLLLMEDFCESAHSVPIWEGLCEEQLLHIVKHLANFHAFLSRPSIKEKWKSAFISVKEYLQTTFHYILAKLHAKIMGQHGDENFRTLLEALLNPEIITWMEEKCAKEYNIPAILAHNDLWLNNILWSNKDPNNVAAFIDWQLTTIANPMTDVSRLTAMNMDPELRHKIEEEGKLFRIYLEELNSKLAEYGLPQAKFGVVELQKAYELSFIGQGFGCYFAVQFFEKTIPETDSDREKKLEGAKIRAEFGVKDALRILKQEVPEWLK